MAITSWTDVTNSFAYGTASPYATLAASSNYVQGGAFSSSEIRQDITAAPIYGDVVLTFARANVLADDTGTVTMEALDGGGVVLDSVTTGAEAFAALATWYRRRLALTCPTGTATVRVRLLATRTLGAGNSGAAFDDFDLRLYKQADAVDVVDLDFRTLPVQPLAPTWPAFHLAWPTLAIPDAVIGFDGTGANALSQPVAIAGRVLAMSDASSLVPDTFTAPFDNATPSAPCYTSTRAGRYITVTGGTPQLGAFTSADDFTVRVVLRTDEPTWTGVACGIVGRYLTGGAPRGWRITITAAGNAQALVVGTGSTMTATSAAAITDGAPHQLVLVHNAAADTLRIYVDRRGYSEGSTAAVGEFAIADNPLRVGRGSTAVDGLPGQILECQIIPAALTAAEVSAMWLLGSDPTGLVTTYTRTSVGWCGGGYDPDGHATLAAHATDQLAIGYAPTADLWGLACGSGRTNLITSWDLSTWTRDAGATYAAITDCSGLARGARFGIDATNGVRIATSAVSAVTAIRVAFWAKASAADGLTIRLKTSANALVQSTAVTLSTTWTRYSVAFTTWSGATATALIEWIGTSGAVTMDLAHVVGAFQESSVALRTTPTMIPLPGAVFTGGVTALVSRTMAQQFTAEGEVDTTFACMVDEVSNLGVLWCGQVAAPGTIADTKHGRDLIVNAGAPRFDLYPGNYNTAPVISHTPVVAGSVDLAKSVRVRGRWRRSVGLPEDPTKISSAVITVDGVTTTVTSTTAMVDDTTLAVDTLKLGADSVDRPFPGVIARCRFMAGVPRL
jgi:hypothetical protein